VLPSGAALGAVSVLYFGFAAAAWYYLPVAAILGALISLCCVYVLAGLQASILALVLSGVAISSIAAALNCSCIKFLRPVFMLCKKLYFG
jgi:iron complex transport system permease protein